MEYYLVLLPAALVLLTSKIFMKLCERINLPSVVGMLLAGVLVGLINYIPGQTILNDTSTTGIGFFAQVGVILIMFSAGLETNLGQIKKIGGPAVIITLAGVIVPMGLGFLVSVLFNGGFSALNSDTILTNLFYGTILTATSVSVSVATLRELGKLNSKVGNTIVAAAIMDDIVGIIVLSVVLAMKNNGTSNAVNPWLVIIKMLAFFVVIALIASAISKFFRMLDRKYPHHRLIPVLSLALCFIIAYVSERYFGIADITGAYIVGLILSTNPDCHYIDRKAEILGYMIFVPLFFGNIGLSTQFSNFNAGMLLFGVLFIIAGMIGKVVGCGGAALLCRYSFKDSFKVGVGMMARAEVALVTAQKGVEYGIIDTSIMPFIVLLIIITSFITPISLQSAYKHDDVPAISADQTQS
ncbi:MAG TPA: cation:proton antiporter [Eubacteriales bacterium]|nr:cation:proton antiporter [Eubacteriales bacterium]